MLQRYTKLLQQGVGVFCRLVVTSKLTWPKKRSNLSLSYPASKMKTVDGLATESVRTPCHTCSIIKL